MDSLGSRRTLLNEALLQRQKNVGAVEGVNRIKRRRDGATATALKK